MPAGREAFRSSAWAASPTLEDALEFIIAGATAVQVGTANFVDPFIWSKLLDGSRGLHAPRQRIARVADLVGAATRRRRTAMNRLLVALDVDTRRRRRRWPTALRGAVGGFKVGSQLFTAEGPAWSRDARRQRRSRVPGSEVPRHPEHGGRRGARGRALGVWMLNVHASGGRAMMAAARDAAHDEADSDRRAPLVIARHGADEPRRGTGSRGRRRRQRAADRSCASRCSRRTPGSMASSRRRARSARLAGALRARLSDRHAGHPRRSAAAHGTTRCAR